MFSNVNLLLDLLLLYRKWPNSWNWKWFFLVWALPELKNCIQELFWKENMHITILNFCFETIWKPFGLSPVFFKRLRHCAASRFPPWSRAACAGRSCSRRPARIRACGRGPSTRRPGSTPGGEWIIGEYRVICGLRCYLAVVGSSHVDTGPGQLDGSVPGKYRWTILACLSQSHLSLSWMIS